MKEEKVKSDGGFVCMGEGVAGRYLDPAPSVMIFLSLRRPLRLYSDLLRLQGGCGAAHEGPGTRAGPAGHPCQRHLPLRRGDAHASIPGGRIRRVTLVSACGFAVYHFYG